MNDRAVQITTTTPDRATAERIAGALVERRLAACVQFVGGLHSVYRWQGAIERAEECLVIIKTQAHLYEAVERAIAELHPYETPEIMATPITAGSDAYLRWIDDSVRADDDRGTWPRRVE